VIPAGTIESSWDNTNAVFRKSSTTNSSVNEQGCNTVR